MKIFLLPFLYILSLFASVGCSKSGDAVTNDTDYYGSSFLAITTLSIELDERDAVDDKLMVSSSDAWVAEVSEEAQDWIAVSPSEGGRGVTYIYISVGANLESSARTGEIVVTSSSFTKSIEISQVGNPSLDGDGDTEVDPESDPESESDPELEPEPDSDPELDPDPDENENEEEEESLVIDISSIDLSEESGSFGVTITTNRDWSVSDVPSWAQLSVESGTESGSTTVSYDANDSYDTRSATIIFSTKSISAKLAITQSGKPLPTLSLDSYLNSVATASGSFTIDISSNTAWSVSESLDWVSLSPDSGVEDGSVTVEYDENLAITARSGTITFSADDMSDVEYTITQQSAATKITIDKLSNSVDSSSGSLIMDVTSNSSWTVESESDWVHPVRESGNGNEVLTVLYDENPTPFQRIAFITLNTPSGESVLFTLTQGAAEAYFVVKPTTHIALPKDGGESEISITANVDWEISASEDWVLFDKSSGSGDATVTISADENDSQKQRDATITLSAWSGDFIITITIGQETSQLPDFNVDEL